VANILVVHWAMSYTCELGLEATDASAQVNAPDQKRARDQRIHRQAPLPPSAS